MRNPEFIWYGNLLDPKSIKKYTNFKKHPLVALKVNAHQFKVRTETDQAIKLKPEFDKRRNEDYSKALDWWQDHFHFTKNSFFFPPDDSNLSPRDIMKLYPNHYLSCLPKKIGNTEDPKENEIYIQWYMNQYLKMFPEYNSKTRIEAIEKDLEHSTNPIGFLETELSKIEDQIDFNYRGKASKTNGRILEGGIYKLQKQLFEDLDFRGKEPDWTKAGQITAQKYLDAKCLIEYREYLKNKLVEIKTNGINAKEKEFERIQWNGNNNELVFLLKMLKEFHVEGKPLLDIGGGSKTAHFIKRNFLNKEGQIMKIESLKSTHKPSKTDSTPKAGLIDWEALFNLIKVHIAKDSAKSY